VLICAHCKPSAGNEVIIAMKKRIVISVAVAAIVLAAICAVCVSPLAASAAGVSRANVQTGAPLGGARVVGAGVGVAGAPAVVSLDSNNIYLFVRGTDNALWWKNWTDVAGWSAWQSLGGVLTSDPAAANQYGTGTNQMVDVFVRGADGALWSINTTDAGSNWNAWQYIGGRLLAGTGPAAYGWYYGPTDQWLGWLVTGTDHQLWYQYSNDTGIIQPWQALGGYLTSSPAVDPQGSGVFVRGGDGALWLTEHNAQGGSVGRDWSPWVSLGGRIAPGTAPAVAIGYYSQARLDVFVQGMDGALWHRSNNVGSSIVDSNVGANRGFGTWSAWESLGGYLTSSPGATWEGPNYYPYLDVFVRGGDNALWWKWYFSGYYIGPWSDWTSIGGM